MSLNMLPQYSIIKKLGDGISSDVFLIQDDNGNQFALKCFKSQYVYLQKQEVAINKYIQKNSKQSQNISIMLSHGISILDFSTNICILSELEYIPDDPKLTIYIQQIQNNRNKQGKSLVNNRIRSQYCILMKYMANAELFDFIVNYKMTEEIAKFQFNSILLNVQMLHNIGLVHLDIKPENIMIDEQYNMILCDFGSTTYCDSSDEKCLNIYTGTKEYSCPESLRYVPYNGKQADVFSLGVVVFIMFSKAPPFKQAKMNDPDYKLLANYQYSSFWARKQIQIPNVIFPDDFKDLFQQMVDVQSDRRIKLQEVLNHPWMLTNTINEEIARQFMQSVCLTKVCPGIPANITKEITSGQKKNTQQMRQKDFQFI